MDPVPRWGFSTSACPIPADRLCRTESDGSVGAGPPDPESQCEQALPWIRWPDGLDCPACGSASFCRLRSRRLLKCNRSKRQVSLVAGTIFQSTKLPLTNWFLAICPLAQAKNGISALDLGR